eukprot:gene9130-1219_t
MDGVMMKQLYEMYPDIEDMELSSNFVSLEPSAITELQKFTNIKNLDLRPIICRTTDQIMKKIIKNNPKLEKFQTRIFGSKTFNSLLESKNLKHISIREFKKIEKETILMIGNLVERHPALEYFEFVEMNGNIELETLFEGLSNNKTIKDLRITSSTSNIRVLKANKFFNFLHHGLVHLEIIGPLFHKDVMEIGSKLMESNTSIEYLDWKDMNYSFLKTNTTLQTIVVRKDIDSFSKSMMFNNNLSKVTLINLNLNVSDFIEMMILNKSITELNIQRCSTKRSLVEIFSQNRTVKKLSITDQTTGNYIEIIKSMENNESISHLDIEFPHVQSDMNKLRNMKLPPNLVSFKGNSGSYNGNLDHSTKVCTFWKSLFDSVTLQEFSFSGKMLSEEDFNYLSERLKNQSNLTSIELGNVVLPSKFYEDIKWNSTLKKLNFSSVNLSLENFQYLFESLKDHLKIEDLRIRIDQKPISFVFEICNFLRTNKTIKNLDINWAISVFKYKIVGDLRSKIFSALEANTSLIFNYWKNTETSRKGGNKIISKTKNQKNLLVHDFSSSTLFIYDTNWKILKEVDYTGTDQDFIYTDLVCQISESKFLVDINRSTFKIFDENMNVLKLLKHSVAPKTYFENIDENEIAIVLPGIGFYLLLDDDFHWFPFFGVNFIEKLKNENHLYLIVSLNKIEVWDLSVKNGKCLNSMKTFIFDRMVSLPNRNIVGFCDEELWILESSHFINSTCFSYHFPMNNLMKYKCVDLNYTFQ